MKHKGIICGNRRHDVWRGFHLQAMLRHRAYPRRRTADCGWQAFPSAHHHSHHHIARKEDLALEIINKWKQDYFMPSFSGSPITEWV